ncbi:MAG: DUF4303 domain-containing protein [Planctomycetota bacterium]|nr:DUF4303 domain-containing protein [Planctomycetota bacterium]
MTDAHTTVKQAIIEGVKKFFRKVREQNPSEHFYAFALFTDTEFDSPVLAANSREKLREQLERYSPLDEGGMCFVKWNPGDWAYLGGAIIGAFDAFSEDDYPLPDYQVSMERSARLFGATIDGLKELSDEGFFGSGESRPTVFFTIADDGNAGWAERESARWINPPEVFAEFDPEQWKAARHWYLQDANKGKRLADEFYRIFGRR